MSPAKTCECLKGTFNLDTVEWDRGVEWGEAGQELALARPGRLERRETLKCHPADKNQLSSWEAVKNCSFPLDLHLNNKPLHLEGGFLSSANKFIYCTTWMPTMRLCPWITEISLCKLFLVIRTIFPVVQYQNIHRNLPLYRKGVQELWEVLCGAGSVIGVCWRKWGCCGTFQTRSLSEATSTSFSLILFICCDFLQKLPQNCNVINGPVLFV